MRWPWQRSQGRHAAVPAQRVAPWAQPASPPADSAAVRLGFDDGSEVELPANDPRAMALRAVADVLVQDRPHDADN